MMQVIKASILTMLALILIILLVLNPNKGSFKHWFMEGGGKALEDKMMVEKVTNIIHKSSFTIKRRNYFLFSTYEVPTGEKDYKFIGIGLWFMYQEIDSIIVFS